MSGVRVGVLLHGVVSDKRLRVLNLIPEPDSRSRLVGSSPRLDLGLRFVDHGL